MRPVFFQTQQINCNCFSISPKDKQKIFLSKNQSLNEKTQIQGFKKQQKPQSTIRNESEPSKNKKKSLKKEKPLSGCHTSRVINQQNQNKTYKNQQREKQLISLANIQVRKNSQNQKEHQRKILIQDQFNQRRLQNSQNFATNQYFGFNFQNNQNFQVSTKYQKHSKNIRQPHLNQINPFHELQHFRLMQVNEDKILVQKQKIKERPVSSRQDKVKGQFDIKNLKQQNQSSIQWKNQKNNENLIRKEDKNLVNVNFQKNNQAQKHRPLWSQRKQFNMEKTTKTNLDELPLQSNYKIQHKKQNQSKASFQYKNQQSIVSNQYLVNELIKNKSKSSTRKQSINSKNRDKEYCKNVTQQFHLQSQKLFEIPLQQNYNGQFQNGIYFQNIYQGFNVQQFSGSPVKTINSFRGSKVTYRQKQSITKRLHQKRMMPKQIQSVNDQNEDNMSQISEVVGRGWENDNENKDQQNLEAIKIRSQFKALTLFTRESELNSKTNTKSSQIKTGTQHSLFLSPKSQQMTKMYQFPLNQQGKVFYNLSYKNIENLSQIKNKQCLMNKYFQAQKSIEKSLQKDQRSVSKSKKSRKSSLKFG